MEVKKPYDGYRGSDWIENYFPIAETIGYDFVKRKYYTYQFNYTIPRKTHYDYYYIEFPSYTECDHIEVLIQVTGNSIFVQVLIIIGIVIGSIIFLVVLCKICICTSFCEGCATNTPKTNSSSYSLLVVGRITVKSTVSGS